MRWNFDEGIQGTAADVGYGERGMSGGVETRRKTQLMLSGSLRNEPHAVSAALRYGSDILSQ